MDGDRPGVSRVRRATTSGTRRSALRPRRLADFIAQHRVREQLDLLLHERDAPRARRRTTSCSPARPGWARPRLAMIVAAELGAGLRITSGPAIERVRRPGRDPDQPRRGRRAVHRRDPPDRPAGRGAALQRDGGLPGRRDGRQGSGRDRDPARRGAVHPGRRDHPGRPADRAAAGPVRLRRRTWTSTTPAELEHAAAPLGRASSGVPLTDDGADGDRRPVPGHAADRQPAAAPGPRLRRGPGRRGGQPARPPGPRCACTTSTSSAWTGWTGRCSTRWYARSAAARSACPRSRSRSGSSRTRSRRSASRSWSGPACWPVRPAAGWPPRPPGATSVSSPPGHLDSCSLCLVRRRVRVSQGCRASARHTLRQAADRRVVVQTAAIADRPLPARLGSRRGPVVSSERVIRPSWLQLSCPCCSSCDRGGLPAGAAHAPAQPGHAACSTAPGEPRAGAPR